MKSYQRELAEEKAYLEKTLAFIRNELEAGTKDLSDRKGKLIASRKDMWENTIHFSTDFARLTEMNQYLAEVNSQTVSYTSTQKRLAQYERMVGSPYFGRLDFAEDDFAGNEKIYVGLFNVMDPVSHEILVYDWRAPICGIFYRSGLGKAKYIAPFGTVTGKVLLKRQYKIQNSELKYFFDSSITINDEILQEVLGRNTSPKMRNIVETIQKEQDLIIRDTESGLLIVQGVAGSGKTSVALHRVAFLLYDSLNSKIDSNDIIIISPNSVFSKYISGVLPELGEENVRQATFDDIVKTCFNGRSIHETRDRQLETIIKFQDSLYGQIRIQSIVFKGSRSFIQILSRLLQYYEHHLIKYTDVYFDGITLETKQQLKNRIVNEKTGLPLAKRLKRTENILLDKIRPLQKRRRQKLESIVAQSEGHELEIKSFSRLLSMKQSKLFLNHLRAFTEVDYLHLYKILFNETGLLNRLAHGLELPENIDEIISTTRLNLEREQLSNEDYPPLLYLKLKLEGNDIFPDIRQVVIDEAQDYYPLHYEVFKLLFGEAKYTVLGDTNQTIEKEPDNSMFDCIAEILAKEKTVHLRLNKGYRSSCEISSFTQRLLISQQDYEYFERHEKKPIIAAYTTQELLDNALLQDINEFINNGFESVAIICKTHEIAMNLHSRLKSRLEIRLVEPANDCLEKGVSVISCYMAKGLEFDAVLVYDVNKAHYSSEFDRKLLYIACTRALHRLKLYYTGEKCPFILSMPYDTDAEKCLPGATDRA